MHYGEGGSIPLVAAFLAAQPGAEMILWGCEEPQCKIHAPNESVDLAELERMVLAEALFIAGHGREELRPTSQVDAAGRPPACRPSPPPRAPFRPSRPSDVYCSSAPGECDRGHRGEVSELA